MKSSRSALYILVVCAVICLIETSTAQVSCSTMQSRFPLSFTDLPAQKMGITSKELKSLNLLIPSKDILRFAIPLERFRYLIIYESRNSSAPDPHVLLTTQGKTVAEFAMVDLSPKQNADDLDWRKSFRAREFLQICSANERTIYINLQSGNAGGYFVAVTESGQEANILALGDAAQGRLVVSLQDPFAPDLWNIALKDRQRCTGCPKHYTIKSLELRGDKVIVTSTHDTERTYDGDLFQEHPLKLVQRFQPQGSRE